MDHRPSTIERAFSLARSGTYACVPEIRRKLKAEGYSDSVITGRTLQRQLLALIAAAREQQLGSQDK
jgi:hypothetical protein